MRYRRPILLLVIAALLPLVILASGLSVAWLLQRQETIENEALDRVERTAALLERELSAQIVPLQLLAQSPLLDGPIDARAFFDLAQRFRSERPLWAAVVLSDLEGNRLVDVPAPVTGSPGKVVDGQSHDEVLRKRAPVIGGILRGPRNRPAFAIRVPVIRNDRIVYVLSAVLEPGAISKLLLADDLPSGWLGGVVDAQGRLVARTAGPPELIGEPASASVREAVATSSGGLYEGFTLEGAATVTAFRVLPESGWSVHIGVPRSAFLAPLRRSALLLVGAGALTLGLVLIFLVLLWRELGVRRRAEAALDERRRLEALGRITGGVAHDFNNLLMIVQGSAEALRRRIPDGEKAATYTDAIVAAAERGEALTRQLLAFAGRSSSEPATIRLQDRQGELATLIKQSTRGDINVSVSVPHGLWPVHVDVSALDIALINLAVNAREAMPDGGSAVLSARNKTLRPGDDEGTGLTGDFVAVSLRDSGHGIPPQHIGRIFEPFFTTKDRGTGLGLSQVYGFANQAGGSVSVSSTGKGTAVTLYLPRSEREPAPRSEPTAALDKARPSRGRALLIEDNPDVARVVAGMLADVGFSVSAANGDAEAFAALERNGAFDLVLSDIVMEGASGLEIAREIRKRYPGLPIVLMTGYSEAWPKGSPDGLPVLAKPFSSNELETVLQQVQGRRAETAAV
jgi:signal transduction histidine kinase/CheY-like chemotaxis protein